MSDRTVRYKATYTVVETREFSIETLEKWYPGSDFSNMTDEEVVRYIESVDNDPDTLPDQLAFAGESVPEGIMLRYEVER